MRTPEFDRDIVLDTAMRVFWSKGFKNTSIQDLSQSTGLQRSSLYNTFPGKKGVYMETLQRYQQRRATEWVSLEESDAPLDAVRELVRSVVLEELSDEDGLGCMIANASLEFSGTDKAVRDLTARTLTDMAFAVEAALRRAQALGDVPDTLDPQTAARLIVVTIQGLRVVSKGIAAADRQAWLEASAEACLASLQA